MPWSLKRTRGLLVWTTTLTMPSDSSTVTTPPLTGIKNDRSFTVVGNLQEVSLNNDADVNLHGAIAEDGVYPVLSADVITSLTGSVTAASVDPESVGKMPYHKLAVEPDGTMSQNDVEFAVLQNDGAK